VFESTPWSQRILIGDLNVDLRILWDDRAKVIAAMVNNLGLEDSFWHFRQKGIHRDVNTWQMKRKDKWIKPRCDYILGTDRPLV
jgi:hypothetical protein